MWSFVASTTHVCLDQYAVHAACLKIKTENKYPILEQFFKNENKIVSL